MFRKFFPQQIFFMKRRVGRPRKEERIVSKLEKSLTRKVTVIVRHLLFLKVKKCRLKNVSLGDTSNAPAENNRSVNILPSRFI